MIRGYFELFKLFFFIFFIAHLMVSGCGLFFDQSFESCCWVVVGEYSSRYYEDNWLS